MNAIEFKKVSKQFGAFFANKDVSFAVAKASIHGLIGENGAGKSTAMKVLFGIHPPDLGEIWVNDQPVKIHHPIHAMKHKIGMVHQHFMLAENESVLSNIILGQETGRFFIDRKQAVSELDAISKKYELGFNKWNVPVSALSVGDQQKVEIIKLLYQKSEVLILDEPTAALTPQEVQALFVNIQKLKQEGNTIILISHKLKEVLKFTDSVTVMRRGEIVGTRKTSETNEDELAEMMVGRKISFTYQGERKVLANTSNLKPVLEVKNLSIAASAMTHEPLVDVSLALKPNEIVGIAGVQGNGQTTLLRFLSNPAAFSRKCSGEYQIQGKSALRETPLSLRHKGVGLIPEDRIAEGLLLHQDMVENFLLGQHQDERYLKHGVLQRGIAREQVVKKISDFDIRPNHPGIWTGRMSGGNQQKLVIARALDPNPKILLTAHPTRGVDVGAIEKIHDSIIRERNQGKSVLLFSAELDELIDLSDRILVFFDGRIQGEFARNEFDAWNIGRVMGGGQK